MIKARMRLAGVRVTKTTAVGATMRTANHASTHVPVTLPVALGLALLVGMGVAADRALGATAAAAVPSILTAADVRFLEQRGWVARDDTRALRLFGAYAERVLGLEGIRLSDVRLARIEALECALGRVAARRLGVAQFFADPLFRGGAASLTVLVDGRTSEALEGAFDLHTIFPAVARAGGREVHMLFFLAGQGKLAMAYDGPLTYAHPDDAYAIFGNRQYNLYPFLRMSIGIERDGPALLGIAVADGPTGPLHAFVKRVFFLSPAIRNLYIQGQDVTADTSVINRKIRPPPVEWRAGPAHGAERLRALGCPAEGAWGAPGAGSGDVGQPGEGLDERVAGQR